MKPLAYSLAALVFAYGSVAAADDDSISTDRPDFVESSDVVGHGVVQIETGVNYERDSNASEPTRTYTTPTLLRVGLGSNLELRFETDGRTSQRTTTINGSSTETGFSDLALGLKWHCDDGNAEHHRPATALLLHADLPSGSRAFRGIGVRPSLRGVAEWELSESSSIGIMPGVVLDQSEQHHFVSGIFSVTAGHQLNLKLRGFIEIAGQQISHAEDGGIILTYDAGLTYLLSKSVQIDYVLSRGANRNTAEWNVGGGISVRL